MNEDMKKVFSEMFGEDRDDTSVIEVDSTKKVEVPIEGTVTLTSREEDPKDKGEGTPAETPKEDTAAETPKEGASAEDDEGVDAEDLKKAKEEIGMGGAAFCDEVITVFPDIFARLRAAGKTLHGLFNFSYSYALDEYVRKYGRSNGGGYWNLRDLAEKYLDPNVKEGFTIGEPKVKKPAPKPSPEVKISTSEVKEIAKKAAKAAKKEAKKETMKKVVDPKKEENVKGIFTGFDFSKIDFSNIK